MNRYIQRVLRRTTSLRIQALAALFLLGYVASFAHDVSVRHTLCADHGEWMHDATAEHASVSTHAVDDGTPRIRSTPQETESAHEHCCIVIATRGGRWLAPNAPIAISAPVFVGLCDVVAGATTVPLVCSWSPPARGPPMSA